jgi:NCS1 family nucleobase:cation symporter-1
MLVFFLSILLTDLKYVTEAFVDLFKFENIFQKTNITPIITVAGTIFAYFSIVIVNFGDFSRYVKNQNELNIGNLTLILNLIIFSFFAVFIVVGSDVLLNKNLENMDRILTNPTDIIGKFDNMQITVIVIFFILFASASTNLIANYIPAQNSLLNFAPSKLGLKSVSFIITILSFFVGLFWLTLLSQIGILSFVDTLGSFFGPIFGIMIIDYYLINKSKINNKDIFSSASTGSYYFSGGWHIKGIYSLFIGFIFSSVTIWNPNFMFLQSYSWIIGAFVSSFTYYLLVSR